MNIDAIKPNDKDLSDKYSLNLYRFLKKICKNKYIKEQIKILWLHPSRWDGQHLPFNKEISNVRQIIIDPYGQKSCGYFMSPVLTEGRCTLYSLCGWKDEDFTDITSWFFNTYEQIGRCIFDRDHRGWLLGDEGRYTYVNGTRKCNWCGEWHKKEIVKVQTIKRKIVWNKFV